MTRETHYDNDESDQQSDDDGQWAGQDYEPAGSPSQAHIFAVIGTPEDEFGTVADIYLQRLSYNESVSQADTNSFRLYGDQSEIHSDGAFALDIEVESLAQVIHDIEFDTTLDPAGVDVRTSLLESGAFNHYCNTGFLNDQTQLQDMITRTLPGVSAFRPVCPVCLGMDLANGQLHLRTLVDTHQLLDTTPALIHVKNRNVALKQLDWVDRNVGDNGFDEREWGFDFNEDGEEALQNAIVTRDSDGSVWQAIPADALSPAAVNIVTAAPATTDAVDGLPRKAFGEMDVETNDAMCLVCHDSVEADVVVVEMPCEHFFHEDYLKGWMGQKNFCPTCRFAPPVAEDEARVQEESDEVIRKSDHVQFANSTEEVIGEVAEIHLAQLGESEPATEAVGEVVPTMEW